MKHCLHWARAPCIQAVRRLTDIVIRTYIRPLGYLDDTRTIGC